MRNFTRSASGILLPDAPKLTGKIIKSLESCQGGGVFQMLHCRENEFDFWTPPEPNIVVDTGLNQMVGAMWISSVAKISNWYINGYKNNYDPVAGDTGTLANFTELVLGTDVSQVARPAYTAAATGAGTADNSASLAQLDIINGVTVYGSLIVSAATGTGGMLACASLFSGGGRPVQNLDTLYLKYSFALTNTP